MAGEGHKGSVVEETLSLRLIGKAVFDLAHFFPHFPHGAHYLGNKYRLNLATIMHWLIDMTSDGFTNKPTPARCLSFTAHLHK